MLNAIVLAICGFFAGVGAIQLSAETGSLALSLSITLAIFAFVVSCVERLMQRAHRPAVREPNCSRLPSSF